MAFTIKKRESYRWTVEHALEKREGKLEFLTFDAEFRAFAQTKIEELFKRISTMEMDDMAMLDEIMVGWSGLDDSRGDKAEAFPFSRDNLKALLDMYPGMAASLSQAWTNSVLGGAATRKN